MKALVKHVLASLVVVAGVARAECEFYPGSGTAVTQAVLAERIVVSAQISDGGVLFSQSFSGAGAGLQCSQADTLDVGWTVEPGAQQGGDGVYATSVPGVGLRIRELAEQQTQYWPRRVSPVNAGHYTPFASYIVELIKTGPLQEGRLQLANLAASRRYGTLQATRLELSGAPLVVLDKPTCSVAPASTELRVNLGEHRAQDFNGPGSGSPLVPFSVRMNCEGGGGGGRLFVWMTLTDATDPGNRSTVLSLSNDATARGLGVQVLRADGQVVSLGADSSQLGNPGQWHAGSVAHGQAVFEVPLRARYIQTAPAVSAGSAGALATFTFAYN